jgi:hypothetical protein
MQGHEIRDWLAVAGAMPQRLRPEVLRTSRRNRGPQGPASWHKLLVDQLLSIYFSSIVSLLVYVAQ